MRTEKNKGKGWEFQSAVSVGKMPVFERLLSHEDEVTCTAWAEHGDRDAE